MEGDADDPPDELLRFETSRRLDNLCSDCGGMRRRPNIFITYRFMACYCGDNRQ